MSAGRNQPWPRAVGAFEQDESRCVIEGLAGVSITEPWIGKFSESQQMLATLAHNRSWMYRVAQTLDGIPQPHEGTTPNAGFKAAKVLDLDPDRGDGEHDVEHYGQWGYAWAGSAPAALRYLTERGPLLVAFYWHEGMWQPGPDGLLDIEGQVEGAHAMEADWYDPVEDVVEGWNSWGPNWGANGRWRLTVADFAALLDEGGQASGWYWRAA